MKLAFSTLGCPDWSWDKIVDQAKQLGFQGIELAAVDGATSPVRAAPFQPDKIEETRARLAELKLQVCGIDTNCRFHAAPHVEAALAEGKASIDLAQKLAAAFIRVRGNYVPEPAKRQETIDRIATAVAELCKYGAERKVAVLIETQGDFATAPAILSLLDAIPEPKPGILWDLEHTFRAHEEGLLAFYKAIAGAVRHVHVKDLKKPEDPTDLCMVGQGRIPVRNVMKVLKDKKYGGWLSLEWEKSALPGLAAPEVAFAAFARYMAKNAP